MKLVEMLSPCSAPLMGAFLMGGEKDYVSERFEKEVQVLLSDCLL